MHTEKLQDKMGRRFSYLRLSVTDACNFKCSYCLPDGYDFGSCQNNLDRVEIKHLVQGFAEMGTVKIRLTGGEPTLRKDLIAIAETVKSVPGIEWLALSSNGFKLKSLAAPLIAAGMDQFNISLDSLDPKRFSDATGRDLASHVREGLETALALGVAKLKVNAVMFRASYEAEFVSFKNWIRDKPVTVRFIELMRTGGNTSLFEAQHIKADRLHRLLTLEGWAEKPRELHDGPAREYMHPEFKGRFGIIAPYEPNFCASCNRLRITSQGDLRLCLFGDGSSSLRPLLQAEELRPQLKLRVHELLKTKPSAHALAEGKFGDNTSLSAMGG